MGAGLRVSGVGIRGKELEAGDSDSDFRVYGVGV